VVRTRDDDAVAMTTLDGDERSPNGTTNLFDVTMDDESTAAAAGGLGSIRVVHIHKSDDEPMVSSLPSRYNYTMKV